MTQTQMDLMAGIRSVAFDLDELDAIRSRILRKRAALLAEAIDHSGLNRMEIAMAAGITLNRAYAIAAQARGIVSPAQQLEGAQADSRLITGSDVVDLWGSDVPHSEWLAFPYLAGDDE